MQYSHVNSTQRDMKGTCMRFYILVQINDEIDDLDLEDNTSNTEESEDN